MAGLDLYQIFLWRAGIFEKARAYHDGFALLSFHLAYSSRHNEIIASKVGPIDDLLLCEIRAMRLRRSLTESLPNPRLKREQCYYVMEPAQQVMYPRLAHRNTTFAQDKRVKYTEYNN